ncbi:alpha,alpha-trehalose-phosphate synthase (UDP-forming) [Pseudorhodoplanes sp.]|uniref:alpha,alpha-trehalose-phosphate synthase (UDP-forming) n=1 Tax=Pseudorhodoplanes sp. TaxID=1934341 RepID=UPI00391B7356
MARLVVVSNRVSVPKSGTRAGGLEVAVLAALKRNPGIWFGWSGRLSTNVLATREIKGDPVSYVLTDLPKEAYDEFYYGFANRVLWPILHYRLDLAEFSRQDLSGYTKINEHFADELHDILKPDDIVWVHDYHFLLLAKALRERGHTNRIGFFLHTPFPPVEIITGLPHHERIISALCHYDLVGFQTETDARNFARYVENECRYPGDRRSGYMTGERTVRIGDFPVGVEVDSFNKMARRAIRSSFVEGVLQSLSGRAMIIGVDRLDYSKGIENRLAAFEQFLGTYPEWRDNVTFLQITPKSRSEIPEYKQMEMNVSATVGRVNGMYGEASWTPIRYVNRAHTRTALSGLYRAARAALVTPLRDGMNLVAKEFVAAQDADDPGVLILSRFAGAAVECKPALLVNPYDNEAVAAAIHRALTMPLEERKARHNALYDIISKNDINEWPIRFLSALTGTATMDGAAEASSKPGSGTRQPRRLSVGNL